MDVDHEFPEIIPELIKNGKLKKKRIFEIKKSVIENIKKQNKVQNTFFKTVSKYSF